MGKTGQLGPGSLWIPSSPMVGNVEITPENPFSHSLSARNSEAKN